jgi:hypothetical protein
MAITPGFYSNLSNTGAGSNLAAIATVYGPTAPTSPGFGQIWVDTTNPSAPLSYVWVDPGEWRKISDGTTNTFVSNDAPVGDLDVGDTWYEGDTGVFYVWDGGAWRPVSGGGGAGGTTAIISYTTEPAIGAEGAVYYNSTTNAFYISDGTQWTEVLQAPDQDTNSIVALTPSVTRVNGDPLQAGDNWIDTSTNSFNFWDGTQWK